MMKQFYNKKIKIIDNQLKEEIQNLINDLLSKEDNNNTNNYMTYKIEYNEKYKTIYNE